MSEQSRSEHIRELAKELLDDIELARASAENLLLKASRLARWVGSDEIKDWIKLELRGYNPSNEISLKYMGITGRWTDKEKNLGYWGPLSQHVAAIEAEKTKIAVMRVPDGGGEYSHISTARVANELNASTKNIVALSGIKSKVLARLHSFVSDIYYEKEFDHLSESIFESYKREVDSLISKKCGEVLEQVPAVMDRLAEGNTESISQALITCRRIVDAFADAIFPPTDETIEIEGNKLSLDSSKYQNRINAFIHQRVASQSRKKKIRQNIANLYDRLSTGVHKDVTEEEAKSLFLNTYLILGEILHIGKLELKA